METASSFTQGIDTAFAVILGISLFFLVGITFTMIYFAVRYNKQRNPKAKDVKDNSKLEVLWTVIPTILVLVMFYYGWIGYTPLRKVPNGAMTVKATGRMWSWSFEYENGKVSNTLVVPVKKPVKLELFSPDVVHSLYIPAYKIKEDVVPGVDNYMWFEADEKGQYDILCAEYCGLRHSYMLSKLEVIDEADFLEWYETRDTVNTTLNALGFQILQKNGCIACHSTDGSKLVGPSFKGLYGAERVVEVNGETKIIPANDEYIKRAIYEPNAEVVEGYTPGMMVSYKDNIAEDEVREIIKYLESLNAKQE